MCKYCEEGKLLIDNDINGVHHLGVNKADNKDAYALTLYTPFGFYAEEINFCPKCGDKLGG